MHYRPFCWLVMTMLAAVAGCGSSEQGGSAPEPGTEQPATVSQKPPAAPSRTAADVERAKPAEDVPLSAFEDPKAVGGDDFESLLLVSRMDPQPSDEQKLSYFAPGYFGESDVFKKKEIAERELDPINQRLVQMRDKRFFVFDGGFDVDSLMPYDMQTQTFRRSFCGNATQAFSDRHRTEIKIREPESNCAIKVSDQGLARKLEALRAAGNLRLDHRAYVRVDGIEGNTVQATAIHMHIDIFEETLAERIKRQGRRDTRAPLLGVDLP